MGSTFGLQKTTLHGHEIAYRMAGEGPTLLLIHGMAGSSRTWRGVMPRLAEEFRVLAPDLPGHGDSAAPRGDYSLGNLAAFVRDLLVALDIDRVTVVGQSLGGGVAMKFAYQYPEYAERLVLVSSGGLGREVSWMLRALALPGAEYVMPVVFPSFVRGIGDRFAGVVEGLGWRAPRVAEMWHAYSSLIDVEHRAAFVRTLRAVIEPGGQAIDATNRLYLAAEVPTLIVWGDKDPIIPVSHAHAAHAVIAGSELEIFEGVGHFPHVEEPERFARTVLDFVHSHPSAIADDSYRRVLRRAAGFDAG